MADSRFHVIEFMVLPYDDVSTHVCIPASWVQFTVADHVVVAYPEEDPADTEARVRDNASYSEEWRMYRARIVHSVDTYDEALNYINSQSTDSHAEQSEALNDVELTQFAQISITGHPDEEAVATSSDAAAGIEGPSNRPDINTTPRTKPVIKNKYETSPDHNNQRWKLRHPEPGPGLVEILPDSGVYIDEQKFQKIQNTSTEYNELARRLMEAVFSDEALDISSLTGREAQPYDYDGSDIRPGLGSPLELILRFVSQFGQKNNWGTPNEAAIKKSLYNTLFRRRSKNN